MEGNTNPPQVSNPPPTVSNPPQPAPDVSNTPPTSPSPKSKKKLWILIICLIVVLLLAITGGSAYIYQSGNEKICSQVLTWGRNTTTNECKEYPTACLPKGWESDSTCQVDITPTPPDPTANWQTFTNEKYEFTFMYPERYNIEITDNQIKLPFISDSFEPLPSLTISLEKKYNSNNITECPENIDKFTICRSKVSKKVIDNQTFESFTIFTIPIDAQSSQITVYQTISEPFITSEQAMGEGAGKENIDQILSTFKFTTPQATTPITPPVMRACQMDARICPDGTTVGRSGPNCEFEACPPFTND